MHCWKQSRHCFWEERSGETQKQTARRHRSPLDVKYVVQWWILVLRLQQTLQSGKQSKAWQSCSYYQQAGELSVCREGSRSILSGDFHISSHPHPCLWGNVWECRRGKEGETQGSRVCGVCVGGTHPSLHVLLQKTLIQKQLLGLLCGAHLSESSGIHRDETISLYYNSAAGEVDAYLYQKTPEPWNPKSIMWENYLKVFCVNKSKKNRFI